MKLAMRPIRRLLGTWLLPGARWPGVALKFLRAGIERWSLGLVWRHLQNDGILCAELQVFIR
jgi:hypothetical protein